MSEKQRNKFSKSHRQIECERFRIGPWDRPVEFRDSVAVGNVVSRLIKKLGFEDQSVLGNLVDEWPALVGKAVAAHTRPGRLEKHVLTVYVDNSVWLSELSRYGRKEMLANFGKRFGKTKVKSLIFRLDPGK